MKETVLYLVVPCYNEEDCIEECAVRLKEKVGTLTKAGRISSSSRIVYVNDGSTDNTARLITMLYEKDPVFALINLSGNCGHQNALIAGLMSVREKADAVISIDADL